jgi:hypothetical protein
MRLSLNEQAVLIGIAGDGPLLLKTESMGKIFSGELHRNENAAMSFGGLIYDAVRSLRLYMSRLAGSRKADEGAPGALHALRKLCEGEKQCGGIHRVEVEEWKCCFDAWFTRVKRHFPAKFANEFSAKAADDFRVIFESADEQPEYFWRPWVKKRFHRIIFDSDDHFEKAMAASKEKHGIHFDEFLKRSVAGLLGNDVRPEPVVKVAKAASHGSVVVRFMANGNELTLMVTGFECFQSAADLEQDIVSNAYTVEEAVKNYLKRHSPAARKSLRFDSESSMLVIRSTEMEAFSGAISALARLAADPELFASHRGRE